MTIHGGAVIISSTPFCSHEFFQFGQQIAQSPFVGGGETGDGALKAWPSCLPASRRPALPPPPPPSLRRTLPLHRMQIFAPHHVVAKSPFWCFVSQPKKMQKSSGETVECRQVLEKSPLAGLELRGLAAL